MGGRIIVESVAGCSWNGWPDDRGIRTLAAWKNNNKPALILGYVVLIQLVTSLYALSKIAGPILHHSITFIPMISIFIALQALLLINQNRSSTRIKTMLTVMGSLASVFL
ncbi:hypothetical protein A259_23391 [Pseudomonas syringae pv. actinidiae ICMP 19070]|nr:hypothetical protein A259_23391 [Pseudomonas syringae pv. actinidiae ICMP 19070]